MKYIIFAPDKKRFIKDMKKAWKMGAIRTWVTDAETGHPNIITITIKKEY